MAAQRLDKIIASTGRWSRREVKDLVRQGRVTVDDVPARSAEEKADPEQAVIAVNGELLNWRRYTWVMLNKPAGYLSATEDGRGATVLDLLPQDCNTAPGLAKRTLALCKEAGVVMTGAGATFPYGKDPQDSNIRIAPSLPPVEELEQAMDVFCTCLKLAALEQKLG